jgi:hypothetical protein
MNLFSLEVSSDEVRCLEYNFEDVVVQASVEMKFIGCSDPTLKCPHRAKISRSELRLNGPCVSIVCNNIRQAHQRGGVQARPYCNPSFA